VSRRHSALATRFGRILVDLNIRPRSPNIVQISPARAQQSYRHEAFLWHNAGDFTAGLAPFVEEGLEADEPVMVALIPEHQEWLRAELPDHGNEITFVDMAELGGNPARIIPAWQEFLDSNSGRHRPARGIGEPIWPGRTAEELLECQLHEALLNVAIDPKTPFWLMCPYDVERLSSGVVEEAHRSHPVIVEADTYQGSPRYGGRAHVDSMFAAELSELIGDPFTMSFTAENLSRLLAYVRLELYVAGLSADTASDLAAAIQRLALSSLHRGAAKGVVKIWDQPRALVCEIADDVGVSDLLHGRRVPMEEDHDGLWLANQLCDLVQMRSTATRTTVRVHTWK
jgi:hypothetical protein